MLGPYDRIDLWLDRRLPDLGGGSRLLVIGSLSLSGIALALVSLFSSLNTIRVSLDPVRVLFASPAPAVVALLGWAIAVFVFGYAVHLAKRWVRAARQKESSAGSS